jgi:hypothetical protein
MASTPMKLTIYDPETSEVKRELVQLFVPYKLLKAAIRLTKDFDENNLNEEDLDTIAGLVIEVFGGRVTLEELNDGSDVGEMMTVIHQILAKANGGSANPTPPGSKPRVNRRTGK